MKREDVKANIPGITEEQLNWLMNENGTDINREKAAATALQAQLENANAQLKTAQEGLAKFDGVDVAALNAQIAKLQSDMQAQADGFAFDTALDGAIRDAHGRSVKAIRALLDVDTLKGCKDRTSDIQKAIAAAKESDPCAQQRVHPAGSQDQTGHGQSGRLRRFLPARPRDRRAREAGHCGPRAVPACAEDAGDPCAVLRPVHQRQLRRQHQPDEYWQ